MKEDAFRDIQSLIINYKAAIGTIFQKDPELIVNLLYDLQRYANIYSEELQQISYKPRSKELTHEHTNTTNQM